MVAHWLSYVLYAEVGARFVKNMLDLLCPFVVVRERGLVLAVELAPAVACDLLNLDSQDLHVADVLLHDEGDRLGFLVLREVNVRVLRVVIDERDNVSNSFEANKRQKFQVCADSLSCVVDWLAVRAFLKSFNSALN